MTLRYGNARMVSVIVRWRRHGLFAKRNESYALGAGLPTDE
jgi:hypothetical protein